MDTKTNNRTTGMMVGILFLLLSLPVNWMTITPAKSMGRSMLPLGPATATGLTGNLGLTGLQLPIWLVMVLGILSMVFSTLNRHGITSLPRYIFVALWSVSTFHVVLAFALGLFANNISVHLGPVLAATGLGLGLVAGYDELRARPSRSPHSPSWGEIA